MTHEPLLHVSSSPITRLRSRRQLGNEMKPRGLWYGVGTAWIDWCRDEMPHWLHSVRIYEVILRPDARILRIGNDAELSVFLQRYEDNPDWRELSRTYDGIELTTYRRRWDIHATWYYTWDCASGCIWRVRAIQSITEVNFPSAAIPDALAQ